MSRIAITCGPTSTGFLPPIERLLREGGHEVRRFIVKSPMVTQAEILGWRADAAWIEWLDSSAFHFSRTLRIPMIVRMHRYEAETEWPSKMDWTYARLVVTSQHVLDRAEKNCPFGLAKWAKPVVIPSIVDFEAFPLQDRKDADELRIAVVGYFSGRKQPGFALEAARALSENWNVRIDFIGKNAAGEPYWHDYIHAQPTKGFLAVLNPWTEDVASIWKAHDAVLSASADEGCPYNVIEAMACGAAPFIHDYPGAAAQFPPEFLWKTLDDFMRIVDRQLVSHEAWTPEAISAWAESRYSIRANSEKVLGLFAVGGAR